MTGKFSPLRFALLFALGFGVLMASFEAARGTVIERWLVTDAVLVPTIALINRITPGENASLIGTAIATSTSRLNVIRGCEGIELLLMLVAAILAYPASGSNRVRGLLIGAVLVDVLSVARLAALHYVIHYSPGFWEISHGLLLPLLPVGLIAVYFMIWTARSTARPPRREAGYAT
ncbi:MAG TPA: hypothetical protein VGM84_00800 [Steroidobacteraceae bacterium]|jgi:exosortase family protein XrtM